MSAAVRTGLERLLDDAGTLVRGRRVGLLAHPASVTADLTHATEVLRRAGASLRALFGPEHGVGGEAQDMEGVRDGDSPFDALPTHSLYGDGFDSLTPRDAWLQGLDAVVMPPGPINRGVEIDSELADAPASLILDQVEAGVAVRMGVLYLLAAEAGQSPLS